MLGALHPAFFQEFRLLLAWTFYFGSFTKAFWNKSLCTRLWRIFRSICDVIEQSSLGRVTLFDDLGSVVELLNISVLEILDF